MVSGYLKEENCTKTYNTLLLECDHLKEYAAQLQQGKEFPTLVWGKTLKQILNEFGASNFESK